MRLTATASLLAILVIALEAEAAPSHLETAYLARRGGLEDLVRKVVENVAFGDVYPNPNAIRDKAIAEHRAAGGDGGGAQEEGKGKGKGGRSEVRVRFVTSLSHGSGSGGPGKGLSKEEESKRKEG